MPDEHELDRTQAASQSHRDALRRQGNVARSGELSGAVLLLGVLLALQDLAPRVLESWQQLAMLIHGPRGISSLSLSGLSGMLKEAGWLVVGGVAPLLLAAIAVAILANIAQVGFLWAPAKLRPRLDAINTGENVARQFAGGRTGVVLVLNVAKLLLIGIVGWVAIRAELPRIIALQAAGASEVASAAGGIVLGIGTKLAAVLLLLGVLDYGWHRWRQEQQLMLTPHEAREHSRRTDGDPQLRLRLQRIARRLATDRARAVH